MTVSPPVHQQRDWRHLQRATVSEHRALGAMVQKNFRAQLACAASIAVWILQHRPDLAARPRLHLLIAHATEFEALDSGRWLQFIPWLLGRPALELKTSIVGSFDVPGDAGDFDHRLRTHSWSLVKERLPAQLTQGSVGDWLRAGNAHDDSRLPDVCALFSPEFARCHDALLGPDGLLPLVKGGVPLALFSSSEAEQLVDVYTLRAFGLAPTDPECWPNPWALEPAGCDDDGSYARMGWAGEFDFVPALVQPDRDRLLALNDALSYVRDLLDASGDDAFLTLGESIRAASPQVEGEDCGSVLLRFPHDVAVDTANGHVYQIQESMAWLLGSVPKLPAAALNTFPGHDDLIARAMWAVAMHRDHVQPFSRSLDDALRAELANRMEPAVEQVG
jgi:hypothetical protein